jgi:hypothetical protein
MIRSARPLRFWLYFVVASLGTAIQALPIDREVQRSVEALEAACRQAPPESHRWAHARTVELFRSLGMPPRSARFSRRTVATGSSVYLLLWSLQERSPLGLDAIADRLEPFFFATETERLEYSALQQAMRRLVSTNYVGRREPQRGRAPSFVLRAAGEELRREIRDTWVSLFEEGERARGFDTRSSLTQSQITRQKKRAADVTLLQFAVLNAATTRFVPYRDVIAPLGARASTPSAITQAVEALRRRRLIQVRELQSEGLVIRTTLAGERARVRAFVFYAFAPTMFDAEAP